MNMAERQAVYDKLKSSGQVYSKDALVKSSQTAQSKKSAPEMKFVGAKVLPKRKALMLSTATTTTRQSRPKESHSDYLNDAMKWVGEQIKPIVGEDSDVYGVLSSTRTSSDDKFTQIRNGLSAKFDRFLEDMKYTFGYPLDLYTIDNGTYNHGYGTRTGVITPAMWKSFDNQNVAGGHAMYEYR